MKQLKPRRKISGALALPGDKSISHRAALMGLLVSEPLQITNYSDGADCEATLAAVESLGVEIQRGSKPGDLTLTPPAEIVVSNPLLDCGNSGTTARLLTGLLSGLGVAVELTGDESLRSRPMERVIKPLTELGAGFESSDGRLPLKILGGATGSINYTLPVPSAQVKSALLLAACAGHGAAIVTEPIATRDHTERMLKHLGARIDVSSPRIEIREDTDDPRRKSRVVLDDWQSRVTVRGNGVLGGGVIDIPGDISTAAFLFAAAAIGRGEVSITNVGLNKTRTAFLECLRSVGCEVDIDRRAELAGEPRGRVTVRGSELRSRKISGALAAGLIDEIPIVGVMACFAEGPTVIRDVGELRVKESDRLAAIAENLRLMGASVGTIDDDGLVIEAKGEMQPADFRSFGDHRIAMALVIASMFLPGTSTIDDIECVGVSCPRFFEMIEQISRP
ncbi:MAG: 3-phosphoshikimate 1-carboxyvinyltransferase [Candidatus Zixiibacteriota bacterium]